MEQGGTIGCAPAVRYTSADTDSRQQYTAEGACAPSAPAAHRPHADCDETSPSYVFNIAVYIVHAVDCLCSVTIQLHPSIVIIVVTLLVISDANYEGRDSVAFGDERNGDEDIYKALEGR